MTQTTDVTLTLTAQDVLRIYEAGIKRGNDVAVAYDWGERPSGGKLDALEEAMCWSFGDSILPGDADERRAAWENIKREMLREVRQ